MDDGSVTPLSGHCSRSELFGLRVKRLCAPCGSVTVLENRAARRGDTTDREVADSIHHGIGRGCGDEANPKAERVRRERSVGRRPAEAESIGGHVLGDVADGEVVEHGILNAPFTIANWKLCIMN